MIQYKKDSLVIEIKTSSPEESLHNLMQAIAASMRWAAHADKTNVDPDNIVSLAQFMGDIIPNEFQLDGRRQAKV